MKPKLIRILLETDVAGDSFVRGTYKIGFDFFDRIFFEPQNLDSIQSYSFAENYAHSLSAKTGVPVSPIDISLQFLF